MNPAPVSDSLPAESAGARLAQARERLGLSQEQVADKLKLDPYTVVALESDNYAPIGAVVFVRGFLRRYAALVGVAPDEIEALYARQPNPLRAPDLAHGAVHSPNRESRRGALGPWPTALLALALCLIALGWWAARREPSMPAAPGESAVPSAAPAGPAASAAPAGNAPVAPAPVAAPGTPAAASAATAAALEALPRVPLQVHFRGESWAEVYDARGMRLMFGFGHADTTQALSGVPPFRLALGNVGATDVSVNGVAVALPSAAPGVRLHLRIYGDGRLGAVRQ